MKKAFSILVLLALVCRSALAYVTTTPVSLSGLNGNALTQVNGNAAYNYGKFPSTIPFLATNNWSAGTEDPLNIVLVGDSLIGTKNTAIQAVLRQYGFCVGQGFGGFTQTASGGAKVYNGWQDGDVVTAFRYALNGVWSTMTNTGGTIKYTHDGTAGESGKRITIFYDANVIGTFAISNSVDGGSTWGFYGNVGTTGNSATPSITFTNITLPSCVPDILVLKWLSGTNNIPGVIFNPQQDKTIIVSDFSKGGQEWTDMTNMPLNNVTNLANALRRSGNTGRLVIVQETSSANAWTNAPAILNALIQGSGTNTDVLLETCNPFTGDFTNQNQQIISEALTYSWGLWDDHTVFGDVASGTNHGILIPSDPHPTTPAGKYFSAVQMFDGTGLGAAFRSAGAYLDPLPLITQDTHGNITFWPTVSPASGTLTLLGGPTGSPGFFLNNVTNKDNAPYGGVTADPTHVYLKYPGGAAGLTIDSGGDSTLSHHLTVPGDLLLETPDANLGTTWIGLEAASGGSAWVGTIPTNAAPSNVTVGTTAVDFWFKLIAPNGTTVYVPSWKAH
jgi:hypothetical protein